MASHCWLLFFEAVRTMTESKQNEIIDCPWCGQATRLEFVKGHYQCLACKKPVYDCCDGEQNQEGVEP